MKNKKNKSQNHSELDTVPVDLPSSKPDPVLSQMRKNKKKTPAVAEALARQENQTSNHSVRDKKYRVTYTSCTDIENDYMAEDEVEAKAMFCREQGLPVKDFIHKLKARELK